MKEPREGASSSPPLAVQLVEALDLQQTSSPVARSMTTPSTTDERQAKLARRGLVTHPR